MFKSNNVNGIIFTSLTLIFCSALARIHLRVQTTLVGYDIADLKEQESKLLEERSLLKMQLSKLTTKKHLMLMSDSIDNHGTHRPKVAAK